MTTRRNLLKGAAWATPTILATTTLPAYAASKPPTATTVTPYLYTEIKTRTDFRLCNTSTGDFQQGYISTIGTGNDPASSVGFWTENDQPGTVDVLASTIKYIFNRRVLVEANPGRQANWQNPTSLNGWSITQPDPYTIQLDKTPGLVEVSTAQRGTGENYGNYFVNFSIIDGCYRTGGVTIKTQATGQYTDANGTHPFSKNTNPRGI